jgi:hypothetical protein
MTDSAFVLACLEEGPHTTNALLRRSFAERGVGVMIHSRVADLRRDGHDIRCERIGTNRGRGIYQYTLQGRAASQQCGPSVGAVAAASGGSRPAAAPPDAHIPGQLRLVG